MDITAAALPGGSPTPGADRLAPEAPPPGVPASAGRGPTGTFSVIGAGRLGPALAAALRGAGRSVDGPHGREGAAHGPAGADVVVLAVPDAAIAAAAGRARAAAPDAVLVHCSGATGLDALGPGPRRASIHPLVAVPSGSGPDAVDGAPCAISAAGPEALAVVEDLAAATGMSPFAIAEEDRVAYHAAASVAANLLVALEGAAERLAATAGVPRRRLVPLVRGAVEQWATAGAPDALTGPVARGDRETVIAQRRAIAERTPDLLALFDALVPLTARTARERSGDAARATSPAAAALTPVPSREDGT